MSLTWTSAPGPLTRSGCGCTSLRLMLPKAGVIVGLGVAVLALAGCGSASYSVGQVESAFAAHKIPLYKYPAQQQPPGAVELANFAEGVVVLVAESGGRGVGGYFAPGADMRTMPKNPVRQGNLTVYATSQRADAVKAALRQLRH